MAADAVMPISVVIERRDSKNVWQDFSGGHSACCRRLPLSSVRSWPSGEGWRQYPRRHARSSSLFRGETEGYRTNLSQDLPVVFVVLRRNDEAEALDFEPFLVTVCPYEAMGYSEGNDDIVEGVPMPPEVVEWLREFVTAHHVDVPFLKRKNKRHKDDYGGRSRARARRGNA